MKNTKDLPARKYLQRILTYDPDTGICIRISTGRVVNGADSKKYKRILIDGKVYLLHRIIWRLVTGVDPKENIIDHIDRDKTNNAWVNLRMTGHSENAFNTSGRSTTKIIKGVQNHKGNKYRATIFYEGKRRHLGLYDTVQEAAEARRKAEIVLANKRNDYVLLQGEQL